MKPRRPKPEYALASAARAYVEEFKFPQVDQYIPPGVPGGAGGMITRTVAAANATDATKSRCDYVCLGAEDHLMVQEAANAIADEGGIVWLSGGTYEFSWRAGGVSCVSLQGNGVSVIGMGSSATIINVNGSPTATDQPVFDSGQTGFTFGGFYIIDNQGGTDPTIGVDLAGSYGRLFDFNAFTHGPAVRVSSYGARLSDLIIDGTNAEGIRAESAEWLTVTNSLITSVGYAFHAIGGVTATLSGGSYAGLGTDAIIYVETTNMVTVDGSIIDGTSGGGHGVFFDGELCDIKGATIINAGATTANTFDAIHINGDDNKAIGNTVIPHANTRYGLNVAGGNDNAVPFNALGDTSVYATAEFNDAGTGTITAPDANGQFTY